MGISETTFMTEVLVSIFKDKNGTEVMILAKHHKQSCQSAHDIDMVFCTSSRTLRTWGQHLWL